MKYKKIFSILIVLFASFLNISSYEALTLKEFEKMTESEKQEAIKNMTREELDKLKKEMMEKNSDVSSKDDDKIIEDLDEAIKNNVENNKSNKNNTSSNGSGEWCSKFNSIWFVIGRILQVVYVAVPLLLIVTGAIAFLKAVTSKDNNALSKAQKSLVNKIIAAVLVFLLMPLTKIALSFVADEGWYDCAKCVFEPSDDCMDNDITTG